jgi:hypothetical protein
MKKETNLFQEVKKYINNIPVGKEFTTKDLIENVGEFESSTSWKRMNGNPFYRTHSYKSMLRATGFVTNVKRGVWIVNKHLPDFVNIGTIEFLLGYHNIFPTDPNKTYNGLTKAQIKLKIELFNNKTQMEKFKAGDILVFQNGDGRYAAETGSKAEVVGYTQSGYVDVKWLDKKSHGQMDGGYDEDDFILNEISSLPQVEFSTSIQITQQTEFEKNKPERLFKFLEKWSSLLEEYHAEVHDIEGMSAADKLIWDGVREKIALNL